jgi:LPS-assembly protein
MMVWHKFNLKRLVLATAGLMLLCAVTWPSKAERILKREIDTTLTSVSAGYSIKKNAVAAQATANKIFFYYSFYQDTIKPRISDTIIKPAVIDTIKPVISDTTVSVTLDTTKRDSLISITDTFNLRLSKDTLSAPVYYEAEDSAVVLIQDKKIILYGKTKTTYQDITLTAPRVELNQQTNILTAVGERDSLGEMITRARFEQGTNRFDSDSIRFNFKTQQGLTSNTYTKQDEMYVQGQTIKKVDNNTFFVHHGRFTTCNYDDPHFAFHASKLKIINNKVAVSGPTHPEFEGVPLPIYLPFGYFPLSRGRHSGLLPPTFTATENFGLGLEGLGYYQVLNDYLDVTVRGDLYSYGGWRVNISPTYRVRYRYSGALNFGIQQTKLNFKGDPDYNKTKGFNINWSHAVDQRARPGVTFGASVNAGTTTYNQYIINDPRRNFQNQLYSSINYAKQWLGKPYNLTLSANHQQNSQTRAVNVQLPDAGFNVATIYPFQKKEPIGSPKWYEKLGLGYIGSFKNQFSFYDSALNFNRLRDTMQMGATHRIPITLSLPAFGPIIVSPSISYDEQWMMRSMDLQWNDVTKKVDTTIQKGFYTARNISTGFSLNTSIFGTMQFRNSPVRAIRHIVRPNVGFSYTPNLAKGYWDEVQRDTIGNKISYSRYAPNFTQGYTNARFGGLTFGIDNNIEMKVRNRKDTAQQERKIRLVDGFSINSNYNFLLDSFQLGDFNISLRSNILDKVNFTAFANISPYQFDNSGRRINRYAWDGGRMRLGTFTGASFALSTQFRSKPKDAAKAEEQEQAQAITDPLLLADQQRLMDYMRRNPSEFVDFNIPWDIGFDVSANITRQLRPDLSGFDNVFTAGLNFRSSFSLTPKWMFTTNGSFDFKTVELQYFTMSINRDMHCWQMSIGIVPVGRWRSFNITINPKSSILQDLRVNRSRTFTNF